MKTNVIFNTVKNKSNKIAGTLQLTVYLLTEPICNSPTPAKLTVYLLTEPICNSPTPANEYNG